MTKNRLFQVGLLLGSAFIVGGALGATTALGDNARTDTALSTWEGTWSGNWECSTGKISGPLRVELEEQDGKLVGTVRAGGNHYLHEGEWPVRDVRVTDDTFKFAADDGTNYIGPSMKWASAERLSLKGTDSMFGGRHLVNVRLRRQ